MVRAILEGRKTQTRRVVKHPLALAAKRVHSYSNQADFCFILSDETGGIIQCPYGRPGDRLWVRETFRAEELATDTPPETAGTDGVRFAADDAFVVIENTQDASDKWCEAYANGKWKAQWRPSIFLPRWASRITLDVIKVRVERLNEITHADAIAEGCNPHPNCKHQSCCDDYMRLWESINGAGSWSENPWVWVIEFKRIQ
jgi:hypothetical protein